MAGGRIVRGAASHEPGGIGDADVVLVGEVGQTHHGIHEPGGGVLGPVGAFATVAEGIVGPPRKNMVSSHWRNGLRSGYV